MYNKFYGFRENPFSLLPDPDFLFVSEEHGTALNLLELAVLNQSGFCVISGEIGAGKTTIVRELLNRLDDHVTVGLITNTHTSFDDLMRWVLAAFEIRMTSENGVFMHRRFTQFVTEEFKNGKHTLLIVDEAQNLSVAALEQLRMLSNINSGSDLLLQVVLVGQRELRDNLARPDLEQFAQRISIDYFLKPLGEADTTAYIEHRIAHAGGKNPLFDREACTQIYRYCEGVPRVINRLCDLSLVYGYAENARKITAKLVDAVVTEHQFTKADIGDVTAEPAAVKAPIVNDKQFVENSPLVTASQKEQYEAMQPAKVEAQKVEAQKIQAQKVEAQKVQAQKIQAQKVQAQKVQAQKVEAQKVQAQKVQAQKVQAQKVQAQKVQMVEDVVPMAAAVKPAELFEQFAEESRKEQHEAAASEEAEEIEVVSAEKAMSRRQQSEQAAARKAELAMAAVEKATADQAALQQAAAKKLAAEHRMQEVVGAEENASQFAAASKSAAKITVSERTAAEADALERATVAELAVAKVKADKVAAERQVAEKMAREEEAIKAALQTAVAAEKALAERVAAEKAAAEAAAAAEALVKEVSDLRVALESEFAKQLAASEQAAELALAEKNRSSQAVVDKIASEKAAREQAKACSVTAKKKAAERIEVVKLAEEAVLVAKNAQEAADASRTAAERAVSEQTEAEKEVVTSATVEKMALASVAAEQAAEALKAAEMADAAKEAALKEAEEKKAAAAAAAEFAAKAMAAADKAAGREEANGGAEAQPMPRPLTEEPAMKELLLADEPTAMPDIKTRHQGKPTKTWALMAITAIVSGSAWFVVQPGGTVGGASPTAMLGSTETPLQNSVDAVMDTTVLRVSKPLQ